MQNEMAKYIICRGGSQLAAKVCNRLDILYGFRDDTTPNSNQAFMLDWNWKKRFSHTRWERYLILAQTLDVKVAVVPDYEHKEQIDLVHSCIRDLLSINVTPIVVPKFYFYSAAGNIPDCCIIGVSVPTDYAGFLPPKSELVGRRLHLLGGQPDQWRWLIDYYDNSHIVSYDGSHAIDRVERYGKIWLPSGGYLEYRNKNICTIDLAIDSAKNTIDYMQSAYWRWWPTVMPNRIKIMHNMLNQPHLFD